MNNLLKTTLIGLFFGTFGTTIGGIIGGIIGAKLLKKISTKTLRILFIVFLIYTSVKMIIA